MVTGRHEKGAGMTDQEISTIKKGDVIYDTSLNVAYKVDKVVGGGVLTYFTWKNDFGTFSQRKYIDYSDLKEANYTLI